MYKIESECPKMCKMNYDNCEKKFNHVPKCVKYQSHRKWANWKTGFEKCLKWGKLSKFKSFTKMQKNKK